MIELDHLVVVAASLEDGARWCEATLGVESGPGGRHPLMGTHNRLLALGSTEFPRTYLEIIAIDPAAADPPHRRWFELDEPSMRTSLEQDGPRLVHWVARTRAIDATRERFAAAGSDPGRPLPVTRGPLSWRITVREDGLLQGGGAVPTLIQWDAGSPHPTDAMAAGDIRLVDVALAADVFQRLAPIGLPPNMRAASAPGSLSIEATLRTPGGPLTLRTR